MVKLSQQLISRRTRTQRQLDLRQQARSDAEFKALKLRAEATQKRLSGLKSIEEYETEYNKLNPNIRALFSTPSELRASQQQRIEESKISVEGKIQTEEQKLSQLDINYAKSKSEAIDLDPSERASFRRDIDNEYESNKVFIQGNIQGLREGLTRLESGEELGIGEITSYAKLVAGRKEIKESKFQKGREARISKELTVTTTPIDAEKFVTEKLKGLVSKGKETVRNVIGGASEVEVFEVEGGEKVQVVREQDTGKVYFTDLEGEKKGEKVIVQGYSNAEILKLQKEAQDTAIKDWEAERKIKPYYVDIDSIQRGYIKDKPEGFLSFVAGLTPKPVISGVSKVISSGGDIYLPNFIGIAGRGIKVRELTDPLKKEILKEQEKVLLGEITQTGLKETLDLEIQQEYQQRFEDKYIKEIIKGEITFEEAQEEFKDSKEAKQIEAKYVREIQERRRTGKFTGAGFKLAGLSLASIGVKLIPETRGELALDIALIYTGSKILKAIPPKATKYIYGGIGTHGLYKGFFDPKALPEEKAIGVITAGISFSMLGLQGVKYLRKPTIKYVKIKPPKLSLKVEQTIAREGKLYKTIIKGNTQNYEKIIFGKQKIQQIGVVGRRTVVSTKFRDILHIKPVYKGVPTQQLGRVYHLDSLRGSFTFRTEGAYQKALKLITKRSGQMLINKKWVNIRKLTGSQARSVLRYTAPKVYEITLKEGNLLVDLNTGKKAVGRFEFITKQPVISVDRTLGIKTRGGRTVKDIYKINRELVKLKGVDSVIENIQKITSPSQLGKTTTTFRRVSLVKQSDVHKMFHKADLQVLKDDKLIYQLTKKFPYKAQDIYSASVRKQLIPFQRKVVYDKGTTKLIKAKIGREPVVIDFDKNMKFVPYRKSGFEDDLIKSVQAKEKVRKLITFDYVDDAVSKTQASTQQILKQKIKPLTFDYVDDAVSHAQTSGKRVPVSQYEGKGLYERTDSLGALDLQAQLDLSTPLKTSVTPILDIKTQIRNIINIKVDTGSKILSKVGLLSAPLLNQDLQLKGLLKTDLKLDVGIKEDILVKSQLKNLVKEAQVTSPSQKSALKQIQSPLLTTPTFTTPITTTPTFKLPPITPMGFFFPFPTAKASLKQKKRDKQLKQQLLYLPDFTARAIGLEPDILTEKQAQKKLKKVLTGLEIRRGVKITPNKLLRGIPE
jgi:hypothetical protein